MLYLVILLSMLLGSCTVFLLLRLHRAGTEAVAPCKIDPAYREFASHFVRLLGRTIDEGLLHEASQAGLQDIELRSREHQDPYRTAEELVKSILQAPAADNFNGLVNLAKSVYQFQNTFDLPATEILECLEDLSNLLKKCSFAGKSIGRVETIAAGVSFDQRTMMALSYGSQVKQPLGFIVYSAEGKVISKAKVLCA